MRYQTTFIILSCLSSDKIYTSPYKEYAAHLGIFGSMRHALRWPRNGKWLGESRTGKPANSPVGAISRRRRYLIRPAPFFIMMPEYTSTAINVHLP
jgi:hypothetical protein